eukprot:scaffold1313_cov349-Pavlova_lutheri.AAC.10
MSRALVVTTFQSFGDHVLDEPMKQYELFCSRKFNRPPEVRSLRVYRATIDRQWEHIALAKLRMSQFF